MQTEQVLFSLPLVKLEPVFKKWVKEVIIETSQQINLPKAEPRSPIKGIHSLAKYLGVSPAKAQALKNSGILPYFQNGRIVLFDCDKIDEVMHTIKKAK